MKLPKKGCRIEVKWLDAFDPQYGSHWRAVHKIDKEHRCVIHSIGYFFHATKDYVIICRGRALGQRDGVFYIPLACIQKVKKVR